MAEGIPGTEPAQRAMERKKTFASERDERAISGALHSQAHSAAYAEASTRVVPNIPCFVSQLDLAICHPLLLLLLVIADTDDADIQALRNACGCTDSDDPAAP